MWTIFLRSLRSCLQASGEGWFHLCPRRRRSSGSVILAVIARMKLNCRAGTAPLLLLPHDDLVDSDANVFSVLIALWNSRCMRSADALQFASFCLRDHEAHEQQREHAEASIDCEG